MNTIERSIYQISFILNEYRYQQNVWLDEATAQQLRVRLVNEQTAWNNDKKTAGAITIPDPQDLQVFKLGDTPNTDNAETFFGTIIDALSLDDNDDDEALKSLQSQAKALSNDFDPAALEPTTIRFTDVEFTWDNGGGDDNAFWDGYCYPSEKASKNETFMDGLENWLLNEGHAYDVAFSAPTGQKEAMESLPEALMDMSGTLRANGPDEDMKEAKWAKVLEVIAHEISPVEDGAPKRTRRPRA